ncbi:MAG: class I SAM-dependent methyltransferase [Tangfeifania sp.]
MNSEQAIKNYREKAKGREYIPGFFFNLMTLSMKIVDVLTNYSSKHFRTLKLNENQVVVDYGCGPARYIRAASQAVGKNGKVYAVDIHPMAIRDVKRKIKKYDLKNVEALLADGNSCPISDKTADVVYAIDMFHMVNQPEDLLKELHRIVKPEGKVIIEDGHQPREKTLDKIQKTGYFTIKEENKFHVVCFPND